MVTIGSNVETSAVHPIRIINGFLTAVGATAVPEKEMAGLTTPSEWLIRLRKLIRSRPRNSLAPRITDIADGKIVIWIQYAKGYIGIKLNQSLVAVATSLNETGDVEAWRIVFDLPTASIRSVHCEQSVVDTLGPEVMNSFMEVLSLILKHDEQVNAMYEAYMATHGQVNLLHELLTYWRVHSSLPRYLHLQLT